MKKLALASVILSAIFVTNFAHAQYSDCSQYGFMAYDAGDGYCKCMSGYVFTTDTFGNKTCTSANQVCTNKYGIMSDYNSLTNSCECSPGYVLGTDLFGDRQCISKDQSCKNQYGSAAMSSGGSTCQCMSGYAFSKVLGTTQCVDENTICQDRLGYNSTYNILSDQCECRSGYEITKSNSLSGSGFTCESCSTKYGINSSWDYSSKSCTCDDGYTLGSDGTCVKKNNSAYFILLDANADENKILVESNYDSQNYIITYGIGCNSWTMESYLNQNIVINMGTDFSVDPTDTVVLQNNDQECTILSVEPTFDDALSKPVVVTPSFNTAYSAQPNLPKTPTVPAYTPQAPVVQNTPTKTHASTSPGQTSSSPLFTLQPTSSITSAEGVPTTSSTTTNENATKAPSNNEPQHISLIAKIINFFKHLF